MAYRFTGSASTKRLANDDSCFLLSTLRNYEIEEICQECAIELLEESWHLRAAAHYDATLRNAQAVSNVNYWTSRCCRGYEVEESEIECVAT